LRFASDCQIQTFVALEDEIAAAVDRFYSETPVDSAQDDDTPVLIEAVSIERRASERADRRLSFGRRTADADLAEDVFDEATEQTAVRAVDRILARAAAAGASDIHLERAPDSLRVRFRVDGTFQDITNLSWGVAPAICAGKVMWRPWTPEHRLLRMTPVRQIDRAA
jgi:type II secretory ATPase GspE/PulE/Tfp pilus assembly ATPase PilB-like protein